MVDIRTDRSNAPSNVTHMMLDFTLIIPTYNRVQLLAALLGYLEAEKADCRVLVLDSSRPDLRAANRKRVHTSSLDIEFMEFVDETIVEKWRHGIQKVATPFCAVCADDDLVVLDGVRSCLDVLKQSGRFGRGVLRSFCRTRRGLELSNMVYFALINDAAPLDRLAIERYQRRPMVYSDPYIAADIRRAPVPPRRFSHASFVVGATVIEGQAIRLPGFYGAAWALLTYEHWHPLGSFARSGGLFAEYVRYRPMAAAVIKRADSQNLPMGSTAYSIIPCATDQARARFALEFIAGQEMAGIDFAAYWADRGSIRHFARLPNQASGGAEALGPRRLSSRDRSYLVYPQFFSPQESGHAVEPGHRLD